MTPRSSCGESSAFEEQSRRSARRRITSAPASPTREAVLSVGIGFRGTAEVDRSCSGRSLPGRPAPGPGKAVPMKIMPVSRRRFRKPFRSELLPFPCRCRSWGRHGGAAWVHGIADTRMPGPVSENRGPFACSFWIWNVVFIGFGMTDNSFFFTGYVFRLNLKFLQDGKPFIEGFGLDSDSLPNSD